MARHERLDVNELHVKTINLNNFDGSGSSQLSGTESAYLDGATPGTVVASKAVVADANTNIGVAKVTALHIGASGAEVEVTATPAELNASVAGLTATAAELNQLDGYYILENPGKRAFGHIDFNGVGTAAMTITINSVVFQEADTEDFPNGVWTNGASAADSATSLIAAINGDTRNGGVDYTAVADLSGDGLWLVADADGVIEYTIASSTGDATKQDFTGGAAALQKAMIQIAHTVTTQELLSGAAEIPLPFTPLTWSLSVRSAAGLHKAISDLCTLQTAPDRIRVDVDGATNIANTDIITVVASE